MAVSNQDHNTLSIESVTRRLTGQKIGESTESSVVVCLRGLNICITAMLLGTRDKERMAVKLAEQGNMARAIAKELLIFLKTLGMILNGVTLGYA